MASSLEWRKHEQHLLLMFHIVTPAIAQLMDFDRGLNIICLCLFLCHRRESQAFCDKLWLPARVEVFPEVQQCNSTPPTPRPPPTLPLPGMQGNILRAEARCTVCGSNRSRMPWLKAGQGISIGLMLGQMSLCGAVCPQTMGPSATVPVGPAWAPGWAELRALSPCPLPARFALRLSPNQPHLSPGQDVLTALCTLMYVLYQSPLLPPVFTAPRFQHLLSGSDSDLTYYVFSVSFGTSCDYLYSLVCSCW